METVTLLQYLTNSKALATADPKRVQTVLDRVVHDMLCTGSDRPYEVVRAEDGTPSILWAEKTTSDWNLALIGIVAAKIGLV